MADKEMRGANKKVKEQERAAEKGAERSISDRPTSRGGQCVASPSRSAIQNHFLTEEVSHNRDCCYHCRCGSYHQISSEINVAHQVLKADNN